MKKKENKLMVSDRLCVNAEENMSESMFTVNFQLPPTIMSPTLKMALAQCICNSWFSLLRFFTRSWIMPSVRIARR